MSTARSRAELRTELRRCAAPSFGNAPRRSLNILWRDSLLVGISGAGQQLLHLSTVSSNASYVVTRDWALVLSMVTEGESACTYPCGLLDVIIHGEEMLQCYQGWLPDSGVLVLVLYIQYISLIGPCPLSST